MDKSSQTQNTTTTKRQETQKRQNARKRKKDKMPILNLQPTNKY